MLFSTRSVSRSSTSASLPAVAATMVVALAACGAPSHRPATRADASCESSFVDWLYRSGGVTCNEGKAVAGAIFMGDDGDERSSFMKEDFSPAPTVRVAGVGYLPSRVLGTWQCSYSTRRSSYGVRTGSRWLDANGTLRLVSATCKRDAGVVTMTTAMDQRADRRDS